MKKVILICLHDCRLIVRERTFLVWSLLLPLIFVFVFVKAFAHAGDPVQTYLAVVNQDRGQWGKYLVEKIRRPELRVEELAQAPFAASRVLLIPADFSEKIKNRQAQELLLRAKGDAPLEMAAQAEVTVMQGIIRLLAEIVLQPDPGSLLQERREYRDLIELKTGFPAGTLTQVPSGFDHQVPGTLVNFMLMTVMIAGGITIMAERRKRLLERILYAPLTAAQVWLGKFAGRLLVAFIQAGLLLAAGKLLFHFHVGNLFLTALVVFFFSLAITALSLFLGAVLNKEEIIVGLSVLLANVMAALGGCWWPIEIVGRPFRLAGMIFPTYWAMDGFHKIIFFGKGLPDLLLPLAVMFAYAVLFALLSFRFFRIRK